MEYMHTSMTLSQSHKVDNVSRFRPKIAVFLFQILISLNTTVSVIVQNYDMYTSAK